MRRSLILVAVLVLLAAGCAGPGSAAGASSADALHNAADIAFVQALIPHHRAGIALASSVAEAQPSLRTLAEAIIVTEQDEVVRMTTWLEKWGVSPTPPAASASPPEPAGDPDAGDPENSDPATGDPVTGDPENSDPVTGDPENSDPVKALAAHQADAIKIAQQEQGDGSNPAALDFARQIIESRTAQIAQLTPA